MPAIVALVFTFACAFVCVLVFAFAFVFAFVFVFVFVQGDLFHWYPPKKLKYGKPRLGESTLP